MSTFQNFLSDLPGYDIHAFRSAEQYMLERIIEKGEVFLEQGRICREVAFVEEGLFQLKTEKANGESTMCFCKESSFIGSYQSVLTNEPSVYSIVALESSRLVTLPTEAIHVLYEAHPFWQQVGRITAEGELLALQHRGHWRDDLSAEEKYQWILTHEKELLQRVPLKALASYMRITPETLSRVRRRHARN